jgi:uncharacterized protein YbjT (DUF2867 family)
VLDGSFTPFSLSQILRTYFIRDIVAVPDLEEDTMRVAVAGATGNIGTHTVAALERSGHEAVGISRSLGVDLNTGDGLDVMADAEARVGVRHHVLLSIVGITKVPGNAHYAGKREQERLVAAGAVPWTVVPATQFHDFAEMVAGWTEADGVATVAPLLVQPIDPADVGAILAEVVVGEPQGRYADIAGPETQDLVDMARRSLAARGREVRLVPSWAGVFGEDMAGSVLLPGEGARIAPTTFDDWLARRAS